MHGSSSDAARGLPRLSSNFIIDPKSGHKWYVRRTSTQMVLICFGILNSLSFDAGPFAFLEEICSVNEAKKT